MGRGEKAKKTRFFHACQGTLRDQRKRGDTLSSSSSILPRFLCFREKNMTCFSGDVMVPQLSPPSPYFIVTIFTPSTLSVLRNTSPHHAKLCQTREAKFSGSYEKRCFRTQKNRDRKKNLDLSLPFSDRPMGSISLPLPPLSRQQQKPESVLGFGSGGRFFPWLFPTPVRETALVETHLSPFTTFLLTATGEKIPSLPPPSPFLYIHGMLFHCRRTLQPQNCRLKCAGQK